jgi:hypothetical protein
MFSIMLPFVRAARALMVRVTSSYSTCAADCVAATTGKPRSCSLAVRSHVFAYLKCTIAVAVFFVVTEHAQARPSLVNQVVIRGLNL